VAGVARYHDRSPTGLYVSTEFFQDQRRSDSVHGENLLNWGLRG
jgi:hypothetical protein